jgi:Ribbon-helix-helix protein, copG family
VSRLTIRLPDELHQALREAAARRGIGLGELIAESLEFYGVKARETAEVLVARARKNSALDEAAALELALDETRRVRSK